MLGRYNETNRCRRLISGLSNRLASASAIQRGHVQREAKYGEAVFAQVGLLQCGAADARTKNVYGGGDPVNQETIVGAHRQGAEDCTGHAPATADDDGGKHHQRQGEVEL
jgi:hypothetical protein